MGSNWNKIRNTLHSQMIKYQKKYMTPKISGEWSFKQTDRSLCQIMSNSFGCRELSYAYREILGRENGRRIVATCPACCCRISTTHCAHDQLIAAEQAAATCTRLRSSFYSNVNCGEILEEINFY